MPRIGKIKSNPSPKYRARWQASVDLTAGIGLVDVSVNPNSILTEEGIVLITEASDTLVLEGI